MSDSAAQNILSIYRRHADAFASQRSRTLFEKPWLDKFIAVLGGRAVLWISDVGMVSRLPGILSGKAFT